MGFLSVRKRYTQTPLDFFSPSNQTKTFLIIYLCHLAGLKSACLQILQPSMLFLIRTNFTRSFLAKKLSTTINQSDTIQDDQTRVYRLCSINCQLNIIACFILIMQLSSFLNTLLASLEKKRFERAELLLNTVS